MVHVQINTQHCCEEEYDFRIHPQILQLSYVQIRSYDVLRLSSLRCIVFEF